jgi:hypothetical protein
MRKRIIHIAFAILFCLPMFAFSASFKVYPGARLESIDEPRQSDFDVKTPKPLKVITFTTNDPFDTVVAFYRGTGREYRMPGSNGKAGKLSSGQEVKEAFFILDNASDLNTSKHWIKIQSPYLTKWGYQERFEKTRNVTAIIEEDKRSYKD